MSRRPIDPETRARLARLQAVARMQADAALARLAVSAQGRARLQKAIDTLGRAEEPLAPPAGAAGDSPTPAADGTAADGTAAESLDPALVQARLAHRRWLDAQRRMLNERLALVHAEFLTLRPPAQRAFGRAEALERLRDALSLEARRKAARRDETS